KREAALERAVLDLELVVRDAPRGMMWRTLARDQEGALVDDDLNRRRVDSSQVDHQPQLGRLRRAHDVDRRPEPGAGTGEARPLPDFGDLPLELAVRPLVVPPPQPPPRPRRAHALPVSRFQASLAGR